MGDAIVGLIELAIDMPGLVFVVLIIMAIVMAIVGGARFFFPGTPPDEKD